MIYHQQKCYMFLNICYSFNANQMSNAPSVFIGYITDLLKLTLTF